VTYLGAVLSCLSGTHVQYDLCFNLSSCCTIFYCWMFSIDVHSILVLLCVCVCVGGGGGGFTRLLCYCANEYEFQYTPWSSRQAFDVHWSVLSFLHVMCCTLTCSTSCLLWSVYSLSLKSPQWFKCVLNFVWFRWEIFSHQLGIYAPLLCWALSYLLLVGQCNIQNLFSAVLHEAYTIVLYITCNEDTPLLLSHMLLSTIAIVSCV